MIPYERTRQQTIPNSAVKIIGVGGAGANMLDRIALDGMEGAEILACNTDARTLTSSVAPEKIQIGRNLTKGLGTGGDPELGKQAALEAELEIRDALRDRKIIFICVGLGGGTGSGAAPLVARLARECGAFTVVFATTPFTFEGHRRREQAETALNELSVLANALITFDNTRMGELVLAQQGVHEAFSAADRMISESIRAVTRIVMRPGLVNIGLDDLMAALSSPKSRCLFGSGIAQGENRAQKALKNALVSPLLDRGSLLHDTETVLVHVCGGEDLTLYELELLMRGLSKHVPDTAQILFGTSVDAAMADALSVTLVSSLPEERLRAGLRTEKEGTPPNVADLDDDLEGGDDEELEEDGDGEDGDEAEQGSAASASPGEEPKASENSSPASETKSDPVPEPAAEPRGEKGPDRERDGETTDVSPAEAPATVTGEPGSAPAQAPAPAANSESAEKVSARALTGGDSAAKGGAEPAAAGSGTASQRVAPSTGSPRPQPKVPVRKMQPIANDERRGGASKGLSVDEPVKLPSLSEAPVADVTTRVKLPTKRVDANAVEDVFESAKGVGAGVAQNRGSEPAASAARKNAPSLTTMPEREADEDEGEGGKTASFETIAPAAEGSPRRRIESLEEIQKAAKARRPQGELALDGGPKGKFEGQDPNLLEGEDLDIPPFLRRQK